MFGINQEFLQKFLQKLCKFFIKNKKNLYSQITIHYSLFIKNYYVKKKTCHGKNTRQMDMKVLI